MTGLGLALSAATLATALASITPISALVLALISGAIVGNALDTAPASRRHLDTRVRPGLGLAGKTVLRIGVVLLGLRLSLRTLLDLGAGTIAIVVGTVVVTFLGVQNLGRRLGLSRDLSLLVATGFSICGASAIAAVKESTSARDEEVAASIGLVTAAGTLSLISLPILGEVFALRDEHVAIWLGAAIQDVAQVVAAGSTQGAELLAIAVAVKLTRVALLAPIVAGVSLRRSDTSGGANGPILPWFVVGFVMMVVVRTAIPLGDDVLALARTVEKFVLAVAMVGLGSGVRVRAMRSLGARPILLGAMAWMVVSGASLTGLVLVG
ncbi:MAG: putative sulfate exporter family transporter [Actinomycetota bacterium]